MFIRSVGKRRPCAVTTVFVSHPQDKLDMYFGERATAALQGVAQVRFNPEPRELTTPELIAAARGCDALIAYRQTPAPEALFRELPELVARTTVLAVTRSGPCA